MKTSNSIPCLIYFRYLSRSDVQTRLSNVEDFTVLNHRSYLQKTMEITQGNKIRRKSIAHVVESCSVAIGQRNSRKSNADDEE